MACFKKDFGSSPPHLLRKHQLLIFISIYVHSILTVSFYYFVHDFIFVAAVVARDILILYRRLLLFSIFKDGIIVTGGWGWVDGFVGGGNLLHFFLEFFILLFGLQFLLANFLLGNFLFWISALSILISTIFIGTILISYIFFIFSGWLLSGCRLGFVVFGGICLLLLFLIRILSNQFFCLVLTTCSLICLSTLCFLLLSLIIAGLVFFLVGEADACAWASQSVG